MSSRKTPHTKQDPTEAARWEFSEAWYAGENPDVDEFCSRHPECGPELREKIENFLFVAQRFPGMGLADREEETFVPLPAGPMRTGMILGDFRIIQEIGRGGQGVVYEAEQISLRRRVALKVLPSHLSLSGDAVDKFRREAEAGGRQRHPGIVAVHALGEFEGIHYIVYELVGGGRSLADRLDELRVAGDQPVGYFREAAGLAADVADALHHAHQSGVIHRDVKPSNILIDKEGGPKVTDFGLARVEDALALSRTGDFSGTPFYMSPEQAGRNRKGIDLRTDVYSLGATLYEMLTLAIPFDAQTTPDVLRKIIFDDPRDPRRANSRVPRDLAVICLKALEKKREHRYQTMEEFAGDLRRFLAGETILARPAGALARFGKRVRRNPALSVAVGLAAAAAVAALVMAVLYVIETAKAREVTDGQRLIAESGRALDTDPGLSLLLACEGARRAPGRGANNALIRALAECCEIKTFRTGPIETAAMSPDGTRVVFGLSDGTAEIRDSETRELLARLEGRGGAVLGAAFSPDGTRVATGSTDGAVRVWDAATGEEKTFDRPLRHGGSVRAVAFSPDGAKIVSASDDMTAVIWDLSGRAEPIPLLGHTWAVVDAEFSPDGELAVTASEGGSARVWDARTGEELERYRIDLYPCVLCAAAFRPASGRREILTAAEDGTVKIWSLEGSSLCKAAFRHEGARLADAAFGPAGATVATASKDGTARIWRLASYRKLFDLARGNGGGVAASDGGIDALLDRMRREDFAELKGHKAGLNSVVFQRNGGRLLTTARDGTARIWGVKSLITAVRAEEGWTNWMLSPRGDLVVQRSESPRGLRVLDLSKGAVVPTERSMEDRSGEGEVKIVPLRVTDEMEIIPLALDTKRFRKKDVDLGTPSCVEFADECHFKQCAFSPDSRLLAACSYGNNLKVWDLADGKLVWMAEHGGDCDRLALSPDDRYLAVYLSDETIRLVNVDRSLPYEDRREIARSGKHGGPIRSLTIDRGGGKVLTASEDGTARIWFPHEERGDVWLRGRGGPVKSASFSGDGAFVVTVSDDNTCRTWNASTGALLALFNRRGGAVLSADFSPDGLFVATASDDKTVRIWDRDTGAEKVILEGHTSRVKSAVFSADGGQVLTASDDGTAVLWELWKRKPIAVFNHGSPVELAGFAEKGERIISATASGPVVACPVDPLAFSLDHLPRELTDGEYGYYLEGRQRTRTRESGRIDTEEKSGEGPGAPHSYQAGPAKRLLAADLPDTAGTGRVGEVPAAVLEPEKIGSFLYVALKHGTGLLNGPKALMRYDPGSESTHVELCNLGDRIVNFPALSPDGKTLCYLEKEYGPGGEGFVVLRQIGKDGASSPRVLCSTGRRAASAPVWHPRLKKIYFSAQYNDPALGGGSIYSIDVDGDGNAEPVRIIGRPCEIFARPSLSPDGRSFCFIHFEGHSNAPMLEVWKARLDESGSRAFRPERLTWNGMTDEVCVFSLDGRWIYRTVNIKKKAAFVRMRPDGSGEEIVYSPKGNELCLTNWLSLSSSGLLACHVEDEKNKTTRIRIIDPAAKKERTFTPAEIAPGWDEVLWPCFVNGKHPDP